MKMKKTIITLGLFSIGIFLSAQDSPVLVNKGILYVGGDVQSSTPTSLYIAGSVLMESHSSVHQKGKTVLTGHLINNVTSGHVFSAHSGSLEFRGTSVQHIYGNADKSDHYIHFPDRIIINNRTTHPDSVSVILDSRMGATAKHIHLKRGRLILDSHIADIRSSHVAHLLVQDGGTITYTRDNTHSASEEGLIQVNLALGNNYTQGRVVGFTPPFKKIYADYLMFNFLTKPSGKGLFGDTYDFIRDPYTEINTGYGYIIGQGIVPEGDPYYSEKWDPQFLGAAFHDRAKETLSLARRFAPGSLTQFVENKGISDRYTGEVLNTTDVQVTLKQGFNYLGNPFTVPLDMSGFVTNTHTIDDWGVSRASDGTGDVRNSFYVLSQGHGTYHPQNTYEPFKLSVSYLLGQAVGGTLTYAGGYSSLLIAPMQLFIIGRDASSAKTLTIPASARKHGNTKYLRSTPTVYDEIMIEARDQASGGYDRLCVVFREDATGNSTDDYDATKLFNRTGGVNQIYTLSDDGKSMITNVIPPSTRSLPLYFEPNAEPQEVEIEAYRLQSLTAVNKITLEDRKLRTSTSLLDTPVYRFTSDPEDPIDRFVLHFARGTVNIEDEHTHTTPLYTRYQNSHLHIGGLTVQDEGSRITVVDLQGHQLYRGTIGSIPTQEIQQYLPGGIYLVKISGVRNQVIKLSVK